MDAARTLDGWPRPDDPSSVLDSESWLRHWLVRAWRAWRLWLLAEGTLWGLAADLTTWAFTRSAALACAVGVIIGAVRALAAPRGRDTRYLVRAMGFAKWSSGMDAPSCCWLTHRCRQACSRRSGPGAIGRHVVVAAPRQVLVGPHALRVKEWLQPDRLPADADALASTDGQPPVPVIIARAWGAGRVVLATVLDAWRWRLDDETRAFDAAWQALVLSLALESARPGEPLAWRVSGPIQDEVQVVDAAGRRTVVTAPRDTTSSPTCRERLPVGADAAPMIEVGSASTLPATWDDVERVMTAVGGRLVDESHVVEALTASARVHVMSQDKWFVTRQWWFAGLVIGVLGVEWWWRRLARQR